MEIVLAKHLLVSLSFPRKGHSEVPQIDGEKSKMNALFTKQLIVCLTSTTFHQGQKRGRARFGTPSLLYLKKSLKTHAT